MSSTIIAVSSRYISPLGRMMSSSYNRSNNFTLSSPSDRPVKLTISRDYLEQYAYYVAKATNHGPRTVLL